jgi:hypothetical protein
METTTIVIKATYGSDFQKELITGYTEIVLRAMRTHYEQSHKENHLEITINGTEIPR